jgi:hypothetical protein
MPPSIGSDLATATRVALMWCRPPDAANDEDGETDDALILDSHA